MNCQEPCWFSGTLFLCDNCRDPDNHRRRTPAIGNSKRYRPPEDDE